MRTHVLLIAGLLVASSTARANVPDPAHSTIPTRIVMRPDGDLSAELIIRDFANNPEGGSVVVLDFSGCPAFVHCAHPLPEGSTLIVDDVNRRIIGRADAEGRVVVRVEMTGSCLDAFGRPLAFPIYADGVPMHTSILNGPWFMSPDQDGDLVVDATDEAILIAKMDSPGYPNTGTADFNGDNTVDALDLGILQAHKFHVCGDSTPARVSTWGRLKLLYR